MHADKATRRRTARAWRAERRGYTAQRAVAPPALSGRSGLAVLRPIDWNHPEHSSCKFRGAQAARRDGLMFGELPNITGQRPVLPGTGWRVLGEKGDYGAW